MTVRNALSFTECTFESLFDIVEGSPGEAFELDGTSETYFEMGEA